MDFTVILSRPVSIAEDSADIYIGYMKDQESCKEAIKSAKAEAFKVDKKWDLISPDDEITKPEDYKLLVMFYGIHRVAYYGWQHIY